MRDTVALEVSGVVPHLDNTAANRLSAIGIDIDSRNRLTIRSNELNNALTGKLEGVEREDVQKLFGLYGATTNQEIRFISASDDTVATQGVPYRANVTQTAERARILATSTLPASTTIDETNDELEITIGDDASDVLKLAHGSYTPQELVDH